MARLGLGRRWECVFANEWLPEKAAAYRAYFGPAPELRVCDVATLSAADLPGRACLVWASFPCQDLSLAGSGAGLAGRRSGTYWPFWGLMEQLIAARRKPAIIVIENVPGAITSHGGRDFAAIFSSLAGAGYRVGPMMIDAAHFVPQSRPRLFLVAVDDAIEFPAELAAPPPDPRWRWRTLETARAGLPATLADRWVWWNLPFPEDPAPPLSSLIEERPCGVEWHSAAETRRLLSLMSEANAAKVLAARRPGGMRVGTLYRRTRPVVVDGVAVGRAQRAEVRFDEVSGCLRTPAGGSSRQTVLILEGGRVRSRLLSPREAARLMGVPDGYPLPERYNQAYHLFGDGVAVPVVSWLEERLLRPLARAARPRH
jgi:DNA (cytosine-5)-methyltransferase 1